MEKTPTIVCVCFVILVTVVVAVSVTRSRSGRSDGRGQLEASKKAVQTICLPTDYKEVCENSLAGSNTTDSKELIKASFQAAIHEIEKVIKNSSTIQDVAKDPMSRQALHDCKELMGYAIDDLMKSINHLGALDTTTLEEYIENLKIWMGGSITYQQTCLDGFVNVSTEAGEKMRKLLNTSQMLTSNGLAMVREIPKLLRDLNFPGLIKSGGSTRKLLAKYGLPTTPPHSRQQVAVIGTKYMAKDIRFEKTVGAIKHQPMALKVRSDQADSVCRSPRK